MGMGCWATPAGLRLSCCVLRALYVSLSSQQTKSRPFLKILFPPSVVETPKGLSLRRSSRADSRLGDHFQYCQPVGRYGARSSNLCVRCPPRGLPARLTDTCFGGQLQPRASGKGQLGLALFTGSWMATLSVKIRSNRNRLKNCCPAH
jgi:hypothetical protein